MLANLDVYVMCLFGGGFSVAGLAAVLGLWKGFYWRMRAAAYGFVPLGLLFVVYALSRPAKASLSAYYWIYELLGVLLLVVGVWWSMRPPEFIKPAWVRWVEGYPPSVQEAIQKAVMAGAEWKPHVSSQENLEAWVKTLRGKKSGTKAKG